MGVGCDLDLLPPEGSVDDEYVGCHVDEGRPREGCMATMMVFLYVYERWMGRDEEVNDRTILWTAISCCCLLVVVVVCLRRCSCSKHAEIMPKTFTKPIEHGSAPCVAQTDDKDTFNTGQSKTLQVGGSHGHVDLQVKRRK